MIINLSCTFTDAELKTLIRGPLPADTPVSFTITQQIDDERGNWLDLHATIRTRVSPEKSVNFDVEPSEEWEEPDGTTTFVFDTDNLAELCESAVHNAVGNLGDRLGTSGSLETGVLDPNQALTNARTGGITTSDENLVATLTLPVTST